jgi:hypothetical protein
MQNSAAGVHRRRSATLRGCCITLMVSHHDPTRTHQARSKTATSAPAQRLQDAIYGKVLIGYPIPFTSAWRFLLREISVQGGPTVPLRQRQPAASPCADPCDMMSTQGDGPVALAGAVNGRV